MLFTEVDLSLIFEFRLHVYIHDFNIKPDWAIAMKKNDVKHIFFIAETKGSMSSMDLNAVEKAKIDCADKLFNTISTANVKYHKVATYQDLIDKMNVV